MGRLKVHWGQDLSFLFVFYPWSEFLPFVNFWWWIEIKSYLLIPSCLSYRKVKAFYCFFFFIGKKKKIVGIFKHFFARSNCNMSCLLFVDDVCMLFIVYVLKFVKPWVISYVSRLSIVALYCVTWMSAQGEI